MSDHIASSVRHIELYVAPNECGGVRNLYGYDNGTAERLRLNLLDNLKLHDKVTLVFSDSIDAVSPSYFRGLFEEAIKTIPTFNQKVSFKASPIVIRWLNIGLRNCQ